MISAFSLKLYKEIYQKNNKNFPNKKKKIFCIFHKQDFNSASNKTKRQIKSKKLEDCLSRDVQFDEIWKTKIQKYMQKKSFNFRTILIIFKTYKTYLKHELKFNELLKENQLIDLKISSIFLVISDEWYIKQCRKTNIIVSFCFFRNFELIVYFQAINSFQFIRIQKRLQQLVDHFVVLDYRIIYFIQKMGVSCVGAKKGIKKSPLDKVERIDIQLLKLIYMDLSQRSQNKLLSKQDFKIFFHLNGLWSQQLFRKFDKNQNKNIESRQFLETIIHLVGLPFEEKINQLFGIYDLEGHGVISYQIFVKMLFSYPIDELKIILEDQQFKNSLGKLEQSYYFNVENLKDLGEKYNIQLEKSQPRRSKSMEIKGIDKQNNQQEDKEKIMSNSTKLQRQMKKKSEEKKNKFLSQLNLDLQISLKKMPSQGVHFEEQQIDVSNLALTKCFSDPKATKYKIHIKKCKVVSSLTLMVKKYARYLFDLHSQNGDFLTKQAFRKIVNQHPQVIYPFEQGFHSYIWRLDQKNKPKYSSEKIKYQSQCEIVQNDEHLHGYMKFLRKTIMIFHQKNDVIPMQIKCLQGLNVKTIENNDSTKAQLGIIFKHKDGIYPERKYLFKDKNLLQNWIKVLQEYTCNTILSHYELKQIIGSGNFSKVWRAIEKQNSSPMSDSKSNSSRLCEQNNKCVAIKIIEKSKVQQQAYQAIKFQCQLLNLIHHPYIIKMVAKQQTKSNLLIITEYCSQGSLFQYCQQKEYLDEYEAAIVIKQLLEGLCHLSELGIIHRDLKPENIMVIYDEKKKLVRKIKIIDFGLAIYLENLKEVEKDKIAKGTPGFVPPEAFLTKTYYENSDLFSVGIILYEMLSGQLPFQGNSIQQTLLKTVQCNLKFKDSNKNFSWSKISQDVKDFLRKTITLSQRRLSIDEAFNHKWLQNIERLKPYGKYQ